MTLFLAGAQVSQQVIAAATTAPGANPSVSPPNPTYSPSTVPGVCNSYLPEDTSLNRFLFVVNFYAQNGFYIILDNQFNLDQTAINDQTQWLQRVSTATHHAPNTKRLICLFSCFATPQLRAGSQPKF